ncbi:hypothetical protein J4228_04660 [Candidatus Woesearchaeota archaeon]|nr:hypothetical protein [Candidatus Woesearchaeota archaeon]
MVYETVTGTVQEFIDYALTIVSFMIIWYIIKFFWVAPPTKEERKQAEEEWAERGGHLRGWLKEKITEKKKKDEEQERVDKESSERERRKNRVRVPRASLTNAIETLEKLEEALLQPDREKVLDEAQHHLTKLETSLKTVLGSLQRIRRSEPELFAFFDTLYREAATALQKTKEFALPLQNDAEWTRKIEELRKYVTGDQGIKEICASIFHELQKFVKEQERK